VSVPRSAVWLHIVLADQTLSLMNRDTAVRRWPVSTAARGAGERMGSYQTPRGWHRIRALIGRDAPVGAVFVGRRWSGERHTPALGRLHPERDWILSRILWLCGTEVGRNRLGAVDTQRRYIYIHGTPDEVPLGIPGSKGCVRMHNADVIELFDHCHPGMPVWITEEAG
jgi:hypothetical protein